MNVSFDKLACFFRDQDVMFRTRENPRKEHKWRMSPQGDPSADSIPAPNSVKTFRRALPGAKLTIARIDIAGEQVSAIGNSSSSHNQSGNLHYIGRGIEPPPASALLRWSEPELFRRDVRTSSLTKAFRS